ncbi:MAG: glycosyltransferase [Nitrososphaeria archaeon]
MISVVIPTFQRAWALSYSLESLSKQSRPPDEVIIVLKPSRDGSENVIQNFSKKLPIKTVIQKSGFVAQAAELGLKNALGDKILFMDDDCVADADFCRIYEEFFDQYEDAGALTGVIFTAHLKNGQLIKTQERFTPLNVARSVLYRKPLKIFRGYTEWISKSGLTTTTVVPNKNIVHSAALCGANMGFKRIAINKCPLNELYNRSRKGFNYESVLAFWVRTKGFHTYKCINPAFAPIVWHLSHERHITKRNNFYDEFWFSYDVFSNYFRYKKLRADVALISWVLACITISRKQIPAKVAALLYTIMTELKTDFKN